MLSMEDQRLSGLPASLVATERHDRRPQKHVPTPYLVTEANFEPRSLCSPSSSSRSPTLCEIHPLPGFLDVNQNHSLVLSPMPIVHPDFLVGGLRAGRSPSYAGALGQGHTHYF